MRNSIFNLPRQARDKQKGSSETGAFSAGVPATPAVQASLSTPMQALRAARSSSRAVSNHSNYYFHRNEVHVLVPHMLPKTVGLPRQAQACRPPRRH
jgi:hypothetical protein